ncbi:uncharacterized protein CLUP02_04784 [Colletotrichum lupini]|uniref:Uncharacterized protein n=1 Tax=Colletotrichum lupini TaxID=145971 RepID=A0A9Q8SLD9_9PEZI|nr:uncharacterized protein CLUP02_04784 [Colletotrichum lupini]UQC79305.1 hypothetical protein CLUP02_04784 [Colletotrichum lupini]
MARLTVGVCAVAFKVNFRRTAAVGGTRNTSQYVGDADRVTAGKPGDSKPLAPYRLFKEQKTAPGLIPATPAPAVKTQVFSLKFLQIEGTLGAKAVELVVPNRRERILCPSAPGFPAHLIGPVLRPRVMIYAENRASCSLEHVIEKVEEPAAAVHDADDGKIVAYATSSSRYPQCPGVRGLVSGAYVMIIPRPGRMPAFDASRLLDKAIFEFCGVAHASIGELDLYRLSGFAPSESDAVPMMVIVEFWEPSRFLGVHFIAEVNLGSSPVSGFRHREPEDCRLSPIFSNYICFLNDSYIWVLYDLDVQLLSQNEQNWGFLETSSIASPFNVQSSERPYECHDAGMYQAVEHTYECKRRATSCDVTYECPAEAQLIEMFLTLLSSWDIGKMPGIQFRGPCLQTSTGVDRLRLSLNQLPVFRSIPAWFYSNQRASSVQGHGTLNATISHMSVEIFPLFSSRNKHLVTSTTIHNWVQSRCHYKAEMKRKVTSLYFVTNEVPPLGYTSASISVPRLSRPISQKSANLSELSWFTLNSFTDAQTHPCGFKH